MGAQSMKDQEPREPSGAIAWPALAYEDARTAILFLARAFGFVPAVVHAEGEVVHHAELVWKGRGVAMIGSAATRSPTAPPPGVGSVYLVAESREEVDALFGRATAAGGRSVVEPHDTDFAARQFSVADPEGVVWSFGTYAGAG
jgi:uncharacterized glyoxalase superfamily protein PhnB